MKHPDKWRETIDPFSLPYRSFKPVEILGYPHAGNDVFHAKGVFEGKEVRAYIKAARQKGAAIENEVRILSQLHSAIYPAVIDHDLGGTPFSVTLELPGERLSAIVGDNAGMESMNYMEEYGAALAKLHRLSIRAETVKDRRFFHAPSEELLKAVRLEELREFFARPPLTAARCFCHGDFHYANILWDDHHISGILDFELAGYGDRDFDIAWALFRRPGQRFMKTEAEQTAFLRGYQQAAVCDLDAIRYYMAQCYVYFLEFSKNDKEYCEFIRNWVKKVL
ncbi:MAG: aminoglycoside phosphotransferase family protein [Clostridia bacterium]|nr:aminoglycoside phosphotransferase family protein [Clostridia bacterium]